MWHRYQVSTHIHECVRIGTWSFSCHQGISETQMTSDIKLHIKETNNQYHEIDRPNMFNMFSHRPSVFGVISRKNFLPPTPPMADERSPAPPIYTYDAMMPKHNAQIMQLVPVSLFHSLQKRPNTKKNKSSAKPHPERAAKPKVHDTDADTGGLSRRTAEPNITWKRQAWKARAASQAQAAQAARRGRTPRWRP